MKALKMITIKVIALLLCLQMVSAQDFLVAYACRLLRDGNWQMQMTIDPNGKPVDRIQGVDVTSGVLENLACDTTPVVNNINNVQEITNSSTGVFLLTVDINSNTGVASPDCGFATSPADGLSAGQFRWKFEVKTDIFDPAIQFAHEKIYVLFCDFNDLNGTQDEYIDVGSQLTQAPPPEVTVIQDEAKLQVVLATSLAPVNTITAGTVTQLKASLVTEGVVPQNPARTGVSPYNCKACSDSSCAGSVIQLTDANGCLALDANGNPITFLSDTFTNANSSDLNGAELFTGNFEIFAFSSSLMSSVADVVFTCSFDYCDINTGPSTCLDRCAAKSIRKKREASNPDFDHVRTVRQAEQEKGKDKSVYVLIKVINDAIRSRSNPVTGELQKDTQPLIKQNTVVYVDNDECSGFMGFVIGASVLGLALLVGVMASVCLCVKLSRRQRRSEKEIEADQTNPNQY